jgi:hypothetical protein
VILRIAKRPRAEPFIEYRPRSRPPGFAHVVVPAACLACISTASRTRRSLGGTP